MSAEDIKDPAAQAEHFEVNSMEYVADKLRKMRLEDVCILQQKYDQGARDRVDKLTEILNDIDRISMRKVDFVKDRQVKCKDCPNQ